MTSLVPGNTVVAHSSWLIVLSFDLMSKMRYCRWRTLCSPGKPLNCVSRKELKTCLMVRT
jgi:hypothetical protein